MSRWHLISLKLPEIFRPVLILTIDGRILTAKLVKPKGEYMFNIEGRLKPLEYVRKWRYDQ